MNTKRITGEIHDATGHTDFLGTLDDAVAVIMDNVKRAGKWAYVNGNPFVFTDYNAAEEAALREALDAVDEPAFVLTGALQGGTQPAKFVR